jgi:hypothetical protein
MRKDANASPGRRAAAGHAWRRLCAVLALLALAACGESDTVEGDRLVEGDPASGLRTMARLDCNVCHAVPGLRRPTGNVGPPLEGFARRGYVGGILPNRPGLLVRWIRNAPEFAPDTAMPPFEMSEREARNIASYLYTLE